MENKYPVRSTRFTDESLHDVKMMTYEKSNDFALSFSTLTLNEQKLQNAALTCAYNINKEGYFTDDELERGVQFFVPIKQIGKMMGYDTKSKYFYEAIKKAAVGITNKGYLIENKKEKRFIAGHLIDRIEYNPLDNEGNIEFVFSKGSSKFFLNNEENFTLYSTILNNRIANYGSAMTIRLHEVLKTELFKAKSSSYGRTSFYYDFIDLRLKLGLIDSEDKRVEKILNNKEYGDYIKNHDIALLRQEAFNELNASEDMKGGRGKVSSVSSWSNFRARVMVPCQKTFKECLKENKRLNQELLDFMFEFTPQKYKGVIIGVLFDVYTIQAYLKKEKEKGVQLSVFDIYSDIVPTSEKSVKRDEHTKVHNDNNAEAFYEFINKLPEQKRANFKLKDIIYLTEQFAYEDLKREYTALTQKYNMPAIDNPTGLLIKAVREKWSSQKPQNNFIRYEQREYDFNTLEQELLSYD